MGKHMCVSFPIRLVGLCSLHNSSELRAVRCAHEDSIVHFAPSLLLMFFLFRFVLLCPRFVFLLLCLSIHVLLLMPITSLLSRHSRLSSHIRMHAISPSHLITCFISVFDVVAAVAIAVAHANAFSLFVFLFFRSIVDVTLASRNTFDKHFCFARP